MGRTRRRRDRTSRHQFFASEIHAEVETFESVRAEQHHVGFGRKDDGRRSRPASGVDQRESHFTFENTPIGRLEAIDPHRCNA